jgi:hypothetical protein
MLALQDGERKYFLVLWDHGAGWQGYGSDYACSQFSDGTRQCGFMTAADMLAGELCQPAALIAPAMIMRTRSSCMRLPGRMLHASKGHQHASEGHQQHVADAARLWLAPHHRHQGGADHLQWRRSAAGHHWL